MTISLKHRRMLNIHDHISFLDAVFTLFFIMCMNAFLLGVSYALLDRSKLLCRCKHAKCVLIVVRDWVIIDTISAVRQMFYLSELWRQPNRGSATPASTAWTQIEGSDSVFFAFWSSISTCYILSHRGLKFNLIMYHFHFFVSLSLTKIDFPSLNMYKTV